MFGSMKKAMVAGAVVAVGALAGPAMASAGVWKEGGATFAGSAQARGMLTLTLAATGTTTSCTFNGTASLTNSGGVAGGTVSAFRASGCTTNAPNCTVALTAYGLPWSLTTSGTGVTLSGIYLGYVYGGGASCPLNGVNTALWGATTGVMAPGSSAIVYSNAPGLTSPFGAQTVSGSLDVHAENASGEPDMARPITLAP